jgi:hypothetical protein
VFLGVLAAASGCKKPPPQETTTPTTTAPPLDHLAPNELSEGKEKAFELLLPKQVKVAMRSFNLVVVEGEVTPEALANYIRTHVKDGKATVGASMTLFEDVRVRGDATARPLTIRVERAMAGSKLTRMTVRDATPPPEPTGDVPTKLRGVGLSPDGKLVDPKHLE